MGAFEWEAPDIHLQASTIRITVREEQDGKWEQPAKVEISIVPPLPSLRIERGGGPLLIEVGLLPGEKLFYRHQFPTMEAVKTSAAA